MITRLLISVLMGGVGGALLFQAGWHAHARHLARKWRAARCLECGAEPRPRLLHLSGCESGWPDPNTLKLPGESPR